VKKCSFPGIAAQGKREECVFRRHKAQFDTSDITLAFAFEGPPTPPQPDLPEARDTPCLIDNEIIAVTSDTGSFLHGLGQQVE
jgi:hypothetical protein